ncbi:MAG: YggT family protein [Armatimonadetes bacterium]|nr:YggT family protein [Armatimonadota bacterium]
MGQILYLLLQIYSYIIILDVILSWVIMANPNMGPMHTIKRFVDGLVEPALYPIRRALQPYTRDIPIDFSPIVLLLLISVLQRLVIRLIPY